MIADANIVYTDLVKSREKTNGLQKLFSTNIFGNSKDQLSEISHLLSNKTHTARLTPLVHKLRIVKSPAEIECMRQAGRISSIAFNETMKAKLQSEHQISATLDYNFRIGGCEKSAYVPVVAGGENALTIHYTKNNQQLE